MIRSWLAAGLAALLVSGCAWEPVRSDPGVTTPPASGDPASVHERAAATALALVGTPYLWGGTTPDGFDCSGLVQYAYGRHGVNVPRTAAAQRSATASVDLPVARAGDLVFFRTGARGGHVGILVGNGRFVHAPSSGKTVTVGRLNKPWYRDKLIHVGRVRVD